MLNIETIAAVVAVVGAFGLLIWNARTKPKIPEFVGRSDYSAFPFTDDGPILYGDHATGATLGMAAMEPEVASAVWNDGTPVAAGEQPRHVPISHAPSLSNLPVTETQPMPPADFMPPMPEFLKRKAEPKPEPSEPATGLVFEPYPGAFDHVLGPDEPEAPKPEPVAAVEAPKAPRKRSRKRKA